MTDNEDLNQEYNKEQGLTKEEMEEISYTDEERAAIQEMSDEKSSLLKDIKAEQFKDSEEDFEDDEDEDEETETIGDIDLPNEREPDPDKGYEDMRDNIGEALYEDLKAVFKNYFNGKCNYYNGKDNLDKLKQHAISDIQGITAENLKAD